VESRRRSRYALAVTLSNLGTIMLGVKNLERAVAFYRDTLGLPLRFAAGELAFFGAGAVTLAIRSFSDLGAGGDERRTELVFHVDDIESAYESLKARGVRFAREPRIVTGDQLAADFRDPDGHVLSIFGPSKRT
jgi:catechol 2,3-dioxygenase-like lactoylglutathione lyase family enzyme